MQIGIYIVENEEYPIYYMPEIQRIICNGVRFCAPARPDRICPECEEVRH